MTITDQSTVREAKDFLNENYEKGVPCPCCTQFVKMYKRKLNSAMAYGLILITKNKNKTNTSEWFHLENYLKPLDIPSTLRGDIPKLKHWGLLEAMEGRRDDGSKRVGYYRLTEDGKKFAKGMIKVQEKALLFNQKFYGFEGDEITIVDALDKKFDYAELMGWPGDTL